MRALSIASTGMLAQQTNVDVIANNIANLSTTAYKRQRAEFQDLLYQNQTRVGTSSSDAGTVVPTGIQIGLGVKTGSVYRVHEQGRMVETGNQFDMAINGQGFFQITTPTGGTAYTRDGSFQVNAQGQLVNSNGYAVSPGITVPQGALDVTVNESGEVLATIDGADGSEIQNIGQLDLAVFVNPAGLEATGNNLLTETEASGTPITGTPGADGFGAIEQKFLETSNVDSVTEITQLIAAQRAYEMNSRIISTSDEMLQAVSQLR